jgi:hypothetical protein
VLVTNVTYPLEAMAQLYRDRADAENAFDELKNQWGLIGFTTQDINRCQTVARNFGSCKLRVAQEGMAHCVGLWSWSNRDSPTAVVCSRSLREIFYRPSPSLIKSRAGDINFRARAQPRAMRTATAPPMVRRRPRWPRSR